MPAGPAENVLLAAWAVTLLQWKNRPAILDAACRIDELLLAREKRVAGGADADLDVALGGAGVINSAAGATDRGLVIVGMNICFHGFGKGIGR